MWARVDPTRPHPMITICTGRPPGDSVARSRYSPRSRGADPGWVNTWLRVGCSAGGLTGGRGMAAIPNGAAPGDVLELTVTEPAHGGWCVARSAAPGDQGKVVFVRHALPGERVRARVTSSTARFARAEAVEILQPSPDRVE